MRDLVILGTLALAFAAICVWQAFIIKDLAADNQYLRHSIEMSQINQ